MSLPIAAHNAVCSDVDLVQELCVAANGFRITDCCFLRLYFCAFLWRGVKLWRVNCEYLIDLFFLNCVAKLLSPSAWEKF